MRPGQRSGTRRPRGVDLSAAVRRLAVLLDTVAVYPGRVERCTVNGEVVRAQAGGFYGGWITDRVVGPFKGEPGTAGW